MAEFGSPARSVEVTAPCLIISGSARYKTPDGPVGVIRAKPSAQRAQLCVAVLLGVGSET